jgi:hypothetical protein
VSDGYPWWVVEEAWRRVSRARTPEDRARAPSTFRHAIDLARNSEGRRRAQADGRDLENPEPDD